MLIGVLGDIHGNTRSAVHALNYFSDHKVKRVIQVGDFGAFPMYKETFIFLDDVNDRLIANKQDLYVVRGNHDDPDFFDNNDVTRDEYRFGFYSDWPNIHFAPRAHSWEWEGKQFAQLGGAASIDRQWRTAGLDWWSGELITKYDVETLMDNTEHVDYFFTHDASDHTPWGFDLIAHELSLLCRMYIDRALQGIKPNWHFHGHYHRKYQWTRKYWDNDHKTQVIGLDCDGTWDYYGILDTDKETFQWRTS